MNMLLSVFVLLCVGAVYCGRPPIGPRPPPGTEPIGPAPPIGAPISIRPPVWPLRRCYPQHGGWFYDNLPTQDWPVSTDRNVFYFGCKVWRPTWSSCKGFCESSQNITTRTPPRYDTDCKCCKSQGYQLVKPYPRCWVIRVNIGQTPSVRFETVRQQPENYSYAVVGRCGCQDCRRRGPEGPVEPEEIDEGQVVGRPNPPEVSPAERDEALTTAFREIPALRGVEPAGRELF